MYSIGIFRMTHLDAVDGRKCEFRVRFVHLRSGSGYSEILGGGWFVDDYGYENRVANDNNAK